MTLIALAAALLTLSQGSPAPDLAPTRAVSAAPSDAAPRTSIAPLAAILNTSEARDAMARVAYAEAGNQGESGLAGVVYTIINRLADGRWGATVEAVVDAPHQFEPVMRAGGDWRLLRPVSPVQEATVHTIVELALQGRLPDLTGGAKYFQNRQVVAARAAAGTVPQGLVDFGGAAPLAQIGAHTFYAGPASTSALGTSGEAHRRRGQAARASGSAGGIFFGENRATDQAVDPMAGSTDAPSADLQP